MADEKAYTVKPYAEHIPDEYTETEKAEGASWELGAGFVDVGFEVNGAKVPLKRFKAPAIEKLVRLANEKTEKDTTASTPKP